MGCNLLDGNEANLRLGLLCCFSHVLLLIIGPLDSELIPLFGPIASSTHTSSQYTKGPNPVINIGTKLDIYKTYRLTWKYSSTPSLAGGAAVKVEVKVMGLRT